MTDKYDLIVRVKTRPLIHDITPVRTLWDRAYAHMEYLRNGVQGILANRVHVYYEDQCATCDTRGEGLYCDRCSEIGDRAWKERDL